MRIGIDVGGTNTDGVLIDNSNNVISSFKTNTSDDVNTAVKLCIEKPVSYTHLRAHETREDRGCPLER